ncbi:uncharacterized protein ISCGN_028173 [Ixodes scapularis]
MEVSWRLVRCGKNVPKAKSVILLEDREVVIGRNVAQKYRVDNANVSRNHARLKLDAEGRWSIEDLRSHNGVFVNGEKIPALRPLVILENDLIGLGRPAPTGDDVYVFRLVKSGKDSKVSARVEPLAVTVDDDDDDDDVQITAVINLPAASTSHSRPPAGSVRNAECEQARLRAGASLTAKLTKRTTERNLVRSSFTNGTVSQIQELSPQASIPCKQEPLVATVKAEAEDLLSSNASSSEPVRVCSPIPKQNCAVSTAAVLKAARSETALTTKSGPNKMGSVIVKTEHQDTVWVSTDDSCGSHSSLETCSGIGAPSPMQALNTSVPLQGAGNQFSVVKTEPQTYEVPPVSASKSRRSESTSAFAHGRQLNCADGNSPVLPNPLPDIVIKTEPLLPSSAVKTEPALELLKEPSHLSNRGSVGGSSSPSCSAEELMPHQQTLAEVGARGSNVHTADRPKCKEPLTSIGPRVTVGNTATGIETRDIASTSTNSLLLTKVASLQHLPEVLHPHNVQKHIKTENGKTVKLKTESAEMEVCTRKTAPSSEDGEYSVGYKQNRSESCVSEAFPLFRNCSVVLERLETTLLKPVSSPRLIQQGGQDVDEEGQNFEDVDAGSKQDVEGAATFMFSQEDEIIILSDDEDDTCYTLECQVKKEPEDDINLKEVDNHTFEDVDPDEPGWLDFEESAAGATKNEEVGVGLPEDEDLERRLVWNEEDFEESDTEDAGEGVGDQQRRVESQKHDSSGRQGSGDRVQRCPEVPVQAKNAQEYTPVNRNDSDVLAKKHTFSAPTCSAFLHRLKSGDNLNRSPKKKGSLKEKMMRSMNHRVPMAGGGSAIRKREAHQPRKSSVHDAKHNARGKAVDSKQDGLQIPEEEFFPDLSQNFYEDCTVSKPVDKKSDSFQEASSSTKSSFKNHRIPVAGGRSAVEKGEAQEPRIPEGKASTAEELPKKPHYKSRFQSRTLHLLDQEQSIAAAMNINKKSSKRRAPSPLTAPAKRSKATHAVVEHPPKAVSASSQARAAIHNKSPGTTEVLASPDSSVSPVLSFKQSRRVSRVGAGSQGPTTSEAEAKVQVKEVTTSSQDLNCTHHNTEEVTKRTVVSFIELQPSTRTDQERAEFSERVKASLRKRKLVNSLKSKVNMNTFINFLLSWKIQWLKEQMNAATLPPILDMEKVRAKRNMYSSMDEYKMIHYHFLCLEIWEDVFKKWRDYFSRTKHLTFQSVITHHECPLGDVMILSCVVVVGSEAEQKSEYPMEGHLVRLDLRIRDQDKAALPVLGFITKNKLQSKNVSRSSLPHLLQPLHAPKCVLISLTVYVKARDITLNFNKVHRMTVVSKITPTLRQMEAVADLEQSPYGQVVVRPNAHYFWHRTGGAVSKDLLLNYNSQQQEVVSSAVHAMNMPGSDIRVVILHGPPGTGKTHTLIGIVMGCLFGSSHRSILIVAPSNAAVDEIGRRLLAQRAVQSSQKVPGGQVLKLVRVGQDKMIHPEVRGIVLEELVKKNIQSEKRDRLQDYDREIESRRKRLARLRRDMTKSGDVKLLHRLEFETKHLEADILRLSEEKRKCLQGFSRQSYEMKLKILRKANVVLSTLNSCRSRLLEEAFGRASPQCFSSVIVDEATQCTEVETLLCLQYRTSRLVLIGDPLQLPATVLSRHAVQLNFQESLFERFYKCLENEKKGGAQAVFMLTDQRRMHSEICSFPSRYFYDGKLQPVAGLDASYASFPLNPYLVFNVLGSPEMNDGSSTSMANHGEAEFVVRLCHTVRKVVGPGTSICVITFYRAQKTTISELLQRDSSFEVNTVDGFQGQERDVVVLSCVRASHPMGYIGFVADARRLNVSITRARKALFICGHLDTLKDSLEWSALIKDARNRDRVRNVSADCSSRELGQFIAK